MIITAAITVIALSSSYTYVNGICPVQENGTTVVLPYQRISSGGLSDTTINASIQNFLEKINNFGCEQIAELRPSYDSGYYWIQGVSGAVEVYCEMGTNNTFGQSGGWMRIANVDMRNNQSQCPPGLVYNVTEGRRLSQTKTCSRMLFNYIQYSGEWSTGRSVVK